MSILSEVKNQIILKNYSVFLLPISFCFLFLTPFLSLAFFILFIYINETKINMSHLLLYISHNPPNKYNKTVQKSLLQHKLSTLIDNVDLIEKTLNQNDWLLNNIHHFNKLRALRCGKFVMYLNKFDYSTIEYYFKEEINLMEFENNHEYLAFILLINDKKLRLENEVKENKEHTLPEAGITMVKGIGSVEII